MNGLWKLKEEDKVRALKLLKEAGIEVQVDIATPYEHADDIVDLYLDTESEKIKEVHAKSGTALTYEEYVYSLKTMMFYYVRHQESIYDEFYSMIGNLCDKHSEERADIEFFHKYRGTKIVL